MTVVYDAFKSGQDGQNLGMALLVMVFDAVAVWYVLTLARAGRNGPPTSSSQTSAFFMNSVGSHPASALSMVGLASAALIIPPLIDYWHDTSLFVRGQYMTVTGRIEQDIVIEIAAPPHGRGTIQLGATVPKQHESDRLTVVGKAFVVQCTRPTETSFGVMGIAGECLDQVGMGSRVRIDYLPGRAEPLRIELLN